MLSLSYLQEEINKAVEREREECAKVLERNAFATSSSVTRGILLEQATAIRERGELN